MLELEPAGADLGHKSADARLGGRQVGFSRGDRRLLDRERDLKRFAVELDQDASGFDPHIVVDQDPAHLTGDPRRHEGDVPVDVCIVGGNRVECGLDEGDHQISDAAQAAQHGQQEQTFSQSMTRPRGLIRFRGLGGGDGG